VLPLGVGQRDLEAGAGAYRRRGLLASTPDLRSTA
jgi:hypothetical protein